MQNPVTPLFVPESCLADLTAPLAVNARLQVPHTRPCSAAQAELSEKFFDEAIKGVHIAFMRALLAKR